MGLVSPPHLSLDLKPPTNNSANFPGTISGFLRELSIIADDSERLNKLEAFLNRLEQEYTKIQVFQRELPLCMLLLNDAILLLKEESRQYRRNKDTEKPVLEEFIPSKRDSKEESRNKMEDQDLRDKKDWLSSVQLWSADGPANHCHNNKNQKHHNLLQKSHQVDIKRKRLTADNGLSQFNNGARREELRPMKESHYMPVVLKKVEDKDEMSLPVSGAGLSLLTPGIEHPKQEPKAWSPGLRNGSLVPDSASLIASSNGQSNSQQHPSNKKQRRCWSPELHRRFVNALQQLGGAQVATPKQIRELMQVDGLTNDEVKSHLQKYRLHTRRTPGTAATTPAKQNSQDQRSGGGGSSSKASSSPSGSPQSPFHFGLATGGTSTTATGGDSMDDDSESGSC